MPSQGKTWLNIDSGSDVHLHSKEQPAVRWQIYSHMIDYSCLVKWPRRPILLLIYPEWVLIKSNELGNVMNVLCRCDSYGSSKTRCSFKGVGDPSLVKMDIWCLYWSYCDIVGRWAVFWRWVGKVDFALHKKMLQVRKRVQWSWRMVRMKSWMPEKPSPWTFQVPLTKYVMWKCSQMQVKEGATRKLPPVDPTSGSKPLPDAVANA